MRVIKEDLDVDLAAVDSYRNSGIRLAKSVVDNQKVFTITHGGGHPLYRTDGVLIKENYTPQDAPPTWVKTLSTAWIVPGSSGGPLLNFDNELVGIVTNYDEARFFNFSASLSQIKTFMENLYK